MSFLFIGIICGGLPVLYNKSTVEKRNKVDILFVIIGLIIVWIMSAEPAVTTALMTTRDFMSAVFLFIAGIISAIALILPGISASFMLLTIGLYSVTLNAINNWDILFLIPLGLGAVLGTLATARTIEKLLQRYPSKAYMLILGFVIGSLKPVFPGIPQGLSLIYSGGAFVIGFILVYFISKADVE
jgi:putative membrane protein